MTQEEYTDKLTLIEKQNNTEYDLYFVIHELIEGSSRIKGELSVRAVFHRRRSDLGEIFYGLSNIPDFAVLDLTFQNKDNCGRSVENHHQIYGCIEVKGLNESLLEIRPIIDKAGSQELTIDEGQLLGDILWYRNVLYTNGDVWKYFRWDPDPRELDHIVSTVEKRIRAERQKEAFNWYEEIDLKQIDLGKIQEVFCIQDVQNTNLNRLVEQIDQIEWKKVPTGEPAHSTT